MVSVRRGEQNTGSGIRLKEPILRESWRIPNKIVIFAVRKKWSEQ